MEETRSCGDYIPAAFLRVLQALQYFGHVKPPVLPAALSAFHSAPHSFCRARIAAVPSFGLSVAAEAGGAGVRAGATAAGAAGAVAAGAVAAGATAAGLAGAMAVGVTAPVLHWVTYAF